MTTTFPLACLHTYRFGSEEIDAIKTRSLSRQTLPFDVSKEEKEEALKGATTIPRSGRRALYVGHRAGPSRAPPGYGRSASSHSLLLPRFLTVTGRSPPMCFSVLTAW